MLNNAYALQMKRMETADIAALDTEGDQLIYGVNGPMGRLQAIADEIRRLMTARNAATPEAQAMKQARAVMDGEYRALILILNSFAVVDDETERFLTIIRALNKNIEYIRKHAMSGATAEDEPQDGGGSDGGNTPEPTPVTPE